MARTTETTDLRRPRLVILLAPYGSRGDVQPVAALGRALARRGHDVVLCAPPDIAPLAAGAGLDFVPIGPPQSHLFDGSQSNLATFRAALGVAQQQFEALMPLASTARMIIGAALQFAAPAIAARVGIPYAYVMLSPIYLRSADRSPMGAPRSRVARALQRVLLTIEDARQLRDAAWLRSLRREWDQPPLRNLEHYLTRSGTILLATDPVLTPSPDRQAGVIHTGHIHLDLGASLPEEVETFLGAGAPPVFAGFGSMRHRNALHLASAVLDGIRLAGRRAIVHESLARPVPGFQPTDDVIVTADLPHAALFARVSACVHHGGHGTTIAAARAGLPQVIIPHLGDQFHHAGRAAELGIAPAPVPLASVSASSIARALDSALTPETAARARDFGAGLRTREGTARAAAAIERILAGSLAPR